MAVHLARHSIPSRLLYERRKSVCGESINPEQGEDITKVTDAPPKTPEQRFILEQCLRGLFLFHNLDEDQMCSVIDALQKRKVEPGEYIARQGEEGREFYVVEEGVLNAYRAVDGVELPMCTYVAGDYFGEMYLMYGEPLQVCTYTVRSTTSCTLWHLDRSTYSRIVVGLRSKKLLLLEAYILNVPLLKQLKTNEITQLATVMEEKIYSRNDVIAEQGNAIDGLAFLMKGVLRIKRSGNNPECMEQTREVNPGHPIGIEALTVGSSTIPKWTVTIIADSNVHLAHIPVAAFERLFGLPLQNPE